LQRLLPVKHGGGVAVKRFAFNLKERKLNQVDERRKVTSRLATRKESKRQSKSQPFNSFSPSPRCVTLSMFDYYR